VCRGSIRKFISGILRAISDPFEDVITYRAQRCDVGKISVYDKVVIGNPKKRENMEIKAVFYESIRKRLLTSEITTC